MTRIILFALVFSTSAFLVSSNTNSVATSETLESEIQPIPLVLEWTPELALAELVYDTSSNSTNNYLYRGELLTDAFIEADLSNSGTLKIRVRDHHDLVPIACYLRASGLSGQVLFASAVFEGDNYLGRRNYGFYYSAEEWKFYADNEETGEILQQSGLLNLGGFFPAEVASLSLINANADALDENGQVVQSLTSAGCGCGTETPSMMVSIIEPIDTDATTDPPADPCGGKKCTDCNSTNIKTCPDPLQPAVYNFPATSNCNSNDPAIKDALMAYAYFVEKQLKDTNNCFCFGIDDKRSSCADAWRAVMNELNKAPAGTQNGHIPDTCAGGAPGPFCGNYMPMPSACNQSMGTQCNSNGNPGRCYNKIEFRVAGQPQNWTPTPQQIEKWEADMKKRQEDCCDLFKKATDGVPMDKWPASVRNYVCICLGGKLPACVTAVE